MGGAGRVLGPQTVALIGYSYANVVRSLVSIWSGGGGMGIKEYSEGGGSE